jgi:uncharacterized OB-fold protein
MIGSDTVNRDRAYPPRVTAFTAAFWEALADGRVITTRCARCQEATFPPKPICPHCLHDQVSWIDVAPNGRLYSWTRVHAGPAVFEEELPYAVGVVDLDAGLRLALRLHGAPEGDWRCGMPVRLVRLDYRDGPLLGAAPP